VEFPEVALRSMLAVLVDRVSSEDKGRRVHVCKPVSIGKSVVHVLRPGCANGDTLLMIVSINLDRNKVLLIMIGNAFH
jgi:hypothetical protein